VAGSGPVAWSLIATGSGRKVCCIVSDPRIVRNRPGKRSSTVPTDVVAGAAFSPDGKLLSIAYHLRSGLQWPTGVPCWEIREVATGKVVRRFMTAVQVFLLPNGETMLVSRLDGQPMVVQDIVGDKVRCVFDERSGRLGPSGMTWDGKLVLLFSWTLHEAEIWDVTQGKMVRKLDVDERCRDFRLSPDGKWAFSVYQRAQPEESNGVAMWDVSMGQRVRIDQGEQAWKYPKAFSPDGKFAVSDRRRSEQEKFHLVLWEVETGAEVLQFEERRKGTGVFDRLGHADQVTFTPDGTVLVSSDSDQMIRRWEVGTGRLLGGMSFPKGKHWPALSLDGHLAAATSGGTVGGAMNSIEIEIWDTFQEKLLLTIMRPGSRAEDVR
jgi:WD40 repeat protein